MDYNNTIRNVAIVGVGGHIGSYITRSLLKTNKHTLTALTRSTSTSIIPSGVQRAEIDYEYPETIAKALTGQDCLIITLNFKAPKNAQDILIESAAKTGVKYIMPNEWSPDPMHDGLRADISSLHDMPRIRQKIQDLGVSSYIAITCGLWYEWCLATPVLYGIDAETRTAVLFDDGTQKICTTTWPQIGAAVAALLSLPEVPNRGSTGTCLQHFANKAVYLASFTISQRDMLESVLRVTGKTQKDWKISHESSRDRHAAGIEARKCAERTERGRLVYTRVFFLDGAGNHGEREELCNDFLGLEKEDLDERTRAALTWTV